MTGNDKEYSWYKRDLNVFIYTDNAYFIFITSNFKYHVLQLRRLRNKSYRHKNFSRSNINMHKIKLYVYKIIFSKKIILS